MKHHSLFNRLAALLMFSVCALLFCGCNNSAASKVAGAQEQIIYAHIIEVNEQTNTVAVDEVEMIDRNKYSSMTANGTTAQNAGRLYGDSYIFNPYAQYRILALDENVRFDLGGTAFDGNYNSKGAGFAGGNANNSSNGNASGNMGSMGGNGSTNGNGNVGRNTGNAGYNNEAAQNGTVLGSMINAADDIMDAGKEMLDSSYSMGYNEFSHLSDMIRDDSSSLYRLVLRDGEVVSIDYITPGGNTNGGNTNGGNTNGGNTNGGNTNGGNTNGGNTNGGAMGSNNAQGNNTTVINGGTNGGDTEGAGLLNGMNGSMNGGNGSTNGNGNSAGSNNNAEEGDRVYVEDGSTEPIDEVEGVSMGGQL